MPEPIYAELRKLIADMVRYGHAKAIVCCFIDDDGTTTTQTKAKDNNSDYLTGVVQAVSEAVDDYAEFG